MAHAPRYAYLPAHFAGTLPDDPLGVAQTRACLPVRLVRFAEPVRMEIAGNALAADLRIGERRFTAGDATRKVWSLVDAARGIRLTAYLLEAADDDAGALTVIAAALPLKAGQTYELSLDLPEGAQAILRAGGLARGARVLTEVGKRPIEDITPGTRVWTETAGFQPVLWHGVHSLPARGLAAPLRLPRGLLGLTEDLLVLGTQRVRIEHAEGQVLVPASAFERAGRAAREFGTAVTWHQLLLPDHALIHAGGLAVASVFAPDRLADGPPEGWPGTGLAHADPVLPGMTETDALRLIG